MPLTPARWIAARFPWVPRCGLDTSYPGAKAGSLQRLVLAQDAGGAITSHARADLFWGHGEQAERLADVDYLDYH